MTYFDPMYYNKQNLRPRDRKELEFYMDLFETEINSSLEDLKTKVEDSSETISKICMEVASGFAKDLRTNLGMEFQMLTASLIDEYGANDEDYEVAEVEDYETFLYEEEEKEEK